MIGTLKRWLTKARKGGAAVVPASLTKNLVPMVVLAAAVTALVCLLVWRDQANYKPLFGAREKVAVSDMVAALDAQGIPYRLHPDSGQVLVPESQVGRARMLLAAKGVVAKLPEGLELTDRNDPLGVSQFVQDVRFRRGLEGELSQSIATLDAVESARVHLAIARSTSFVMGDGEKSSASVVLTLKGGRTLNNEQIAAVINMVANSVADLDPKRVSVVDQAGEFLSARVDLSDGAVGAQLSDASRQYQDETRRNLSDLLGPVVGTQNFRASVTADVDNDRVEETVERYGEAPKLTNEATRSESGRDPIALGVPGSLSNRPVAVQPPPQAGASDAAAGNQKSATTRQYAYDRSVTQTQRSRGRLKRLNVAVVLNGAVAPGGKGWTPEALTKVDKLLRSGLGIDSARGDQLQVSAMDFPGMAAPAPWWQERDNVMVGAQWLGYALLALLVLIFMVRPGMKLARVRLAPPAVAEREIVDLKDPVVERAGGIGGMTPALAEGSQTLLPQGSGRRGVMPVVPLLEDYELPPAGSPVDVLVDHLKVLAAKEPERVAEVVRQWVQKNG